MSSSGVGALRPKVSIGDAIVEFSATEAALTDLRNTYSGAVFDLTTTAGDRAARDARHKFVQLRTALEGLRVAAKAPVLERGKLIDAEAKRITTELIALEKPIDEQIKADERRRAVEAQAKAEVESRRKRSIAMKIDTLRNFARGFIGSPLETIDSAVALMMATKIGEEYAEFAAEASAAQASSLESLLSLREHAIETERLRAENAELQRQAAEARATIEAARLSAAAQASFDAPAPEARITPPSNDPVKVEVDVAPPAPRAPAAPVITAVLAPRATIPAAPTPTIVIPLWLAIRCESALEYAHDMSLDSGRWAAELRAMRGILVERIEL